MKVLADASLPGLHQAFPNPFDLTLYHHPDEIEQLLPDQDVLFCRANLKVNRALLNNNRLQYVATASSGTDHLDHAWLASQNIKILDAKGCNAQAVADYILACVAYLSQHNLIQGKKAGIIGLGKVGTQVANQLHRANFQIIQYDPLKAANETSTFQSDTREDLYQVDLLCIHAELHDTQPYPSTNLINQQFLTHLKPGCVLINAARGGLVHEEALLNTQQQLIYCTDVYLNEPKIDKRIIDKALLCTPHIAGHSLEAKYRSVSMISDALHHILGLPLPQYATPEKTQKLDELNKQSWQEAILALYNPVDETQRLKQALNKEEAFLNLRKNHCTRHDFALYADSISNPQTRRLLQNILHPA